MKIRWAGLAVAVALSARSQTFTTSEEILDQIQKQGAQAVVRTMTAGRGAAWSHAMREIATGNPSWLAVARDLRAGTDAANTESLYYAVSHALLAAPGPVLKMISDAFPTDAICTVPDIEPPPARLRSHIRKAKAALAGVHDPSLAALRDQCAARFNQLESAH